MKKEMIDKFAMFITTAFAFAAGMAWNEAIKRLLEMLGLTQYGPFVYAVILTLVAVLVTIWVGKVAEKAVAINVTEELKNAIKAEKLKQELRKVTEKGMMPLPKKK
ncbi:MAG: DUF5654 family protein [Candidatus Nanoarchaeia archaeon]|jgi:uncharacterized PurR-regulated membrane protein YhhQ (DUF165 family)